MEKKKITTLTCIALFFAISIVLLKATPQSVSDVQNPEGFWEGEFMPRNNLTLILFFHTQENGALSGRVLLFQGDMQIQNDPLANIQVDQNHLSFLIEAKNTPFSGTIESDSLRIRGELTFPDGSVHPVVVNKVEKPSRGHFMETKEKSPVFDITHKYSVGQLREDFNFLREQLENKHPQLYFYTSKDNFDKLFDSTFQRIETAMTEDEFFRHIAPLVAQVRCCHTGIRPSVEFSDALRDSAYLFPLDIKFINDKAYIIADYSQNPTIDVGMTILSINGTPIADVWRQLMASIPSDGLNETTKTFEMNTNFSQLYALYIDRCAHFDVECVSPTGKIDIRLVAQTAEEQEKARRQLDPGCFSSEPLPVQLQKMNEKATALLTVKGFWAPDSNQYYTFLRDAFREIKSENIQYLIIDVRGNTGGNPFFAAELLSYLIQTDFTYFELPKEKGEFAPLYQPIAPKKDHFNGDVYALIDGGCLSTTGHFLSLLKYHKIATLIGEESGGSFTCNDGSIQLPLPHTKIILNVPQIRFQTAVIGFKQGEPSLPDFVVKPTLEDFIAGRDAVLDYTLQLIRSISR
ncbi:hypothetical protein JW998_00695 [candidate division KSB1 bacterium]|nr:hypothetical protein [candidate division KSB1 bacterium]